MLVQIVRRRVVVISLGERPKKKIPIRGVRISIVKVPKVLVKVLVKTSLEHNMTYARQSLAVLGLCQRKKK